MEIVRQVGRIGGALAIAVLGSACGDDGASKGTASPGGAAGATIASLGGNMAPGCSTGLSQCATGCVDLRSDPANCGACGNACPVGMGCVAGGCICPAGTSNCDGLCVETLTDERHCGACGQACAAGQSCVSGSCQCQLGLTLCGSVCADLAADSANCGSCGNVCPTGQVCSLGQCTTGACLAGMTQCAGACVDLNLSLLNCGACGNACPAGQSCAAGVCVCPSGEPVCDGQCTDTSTDARHCGACGLACGVGQSCVAGVCTCPAGQSLCSGDCVDVGVDASNCGSCGAVCAAGEGCVAGACTGGGSGGIPGAGGTGTGGSGTGGMATGGTSSTGGALPVTGGSGGEPAAGGAGAANTGGAAPTGGSGGATGGTGASGGSGGGTNDCGVPVTETFNDSVSQGETLDYGPFDLEGSTAFEAVMTGQDDADLYVRFGAPPSASAYDCRPYDADANETCSLTVPASGGLTYVSVTGYQTAEYQLILSYTRRCCSTATDCEDANDCTTDTCANGVCAHSLSTGSCDDGNACTENDTCAEGICEGTPVQCPVGEICEEGVCVTAPELTFYTTSVQDDLDSGDRDVMAQELLELSYAEMGSNTNVSATELNTLLGRTDITTLYHTGHGFEGGIATANGSLSCVQVTAVNVQNAIFATCLTLTETAWQDKMAATSQSILGYTDLSYDGTDNEVAEDFGAALAQGDTYIRAWYSANVVQSLLSDRWCGYVREGGTIVEYSARIGAVPAASLRMDLEDVRPNVRVARALLADQRTFSRELGATADHQYVVSGDDGHFLEYYGDPGEFLQKSPVSIDQAIALADAFLGASLPPDAVLDDAYPVEATVGGSAAGVVAYRVRYMRMVDGMPLRTNGREHHIEVLVDAGNVTATSMLWPTLDVIQSPWSTALLGVSEALRRAFDELSRLVKSPIILVDVAPCFGSTAQGEIVPAYAFTDTEGGRIVVDARTGALVL